MRQLYDILFWFLSDSGDLQNLDTNRKWYNLPSPHLVAFFLTECEIKIWKSEAEVFTMTFKLATQFRENFLVGKNNDVRKLGQMWL